MLVQESAPGCSASASAGAAAAALKLGAELHLQRAARSPQPAALFAAVVRLLDPIRLDCVVLLARRDLRHSLCKTGLPNGTAPAALPPRCALKCNSLTLARAHNLASPQSGAAANNNGKLVRGACKLAVTRLAFLACLVTRSLSERADERARETALYGRHQNTHRSKGGPASSGCTQS